MAVHVPVQAASREVEQTVEGLAGECIGGEHQQTRQRFAVRCQQQIAVAREYADVVGVFVEGVLPAPLADDPDQRQLARWGKFSSGTHRAYPLLSQARRR